MNAVLDSYNSVMSLSLPPSLVSQVTHQTQQLTTAFDSQSQHITDLLAEVQQKESALFSQGEELQRARQELATLRAEGEQEERREQEKKKEEREEEEEESSELQTNHSEGLSEIFLGTSTLTKAAPSAMTNTYEPETTTGHMQRLPATTTSTTTTTSLKASSEQTQDREETLSSTALPQGAVIDRQKAQTGCVSACPEMTSNLASTTTTTAAHRDASEDRRDGGTVDSSSAELLSLKQENRQLRERLKALTVSDATDSVCELTLQAVGEEDLADSTERTIDRGDDEATSARSTDENARSAGAMSAVSTAGRELTPQVGERGKHEGRGVEMEETGVQGESATVAQPQVGHLAQQVGF